MVLNLALQICCHFLVFTFLYERGVGYSAINIARSAVSSVFTMLESEKIGDHPTVCRFMKEIFDLRPSLPRHATT